MTGGELRKWIYWSEFDSRISIIY